MAMTPEQMRQAIISNLPTKTGHDLAYWVEMLEKEGPATPEERILWLKERQGLGHWQAHTIVYEAEKPEGYRPPSDEELVAAQFTGDKASLKPIYELLVGAARDLGDDISIEPRKTYVSLNRQRQFAIIQASTPIRVDLGLALPGYKPLGRLREAGSLGSQRTTHKVSLTRPDEVDEEVIAWLKTAYELDV